ncbi:MAG TPA: hypothetical protein ENK93_01805 [Campylobacteraceae bacterium]|nr:hypothetical protein [Campylobacteraceae bacterium]HHD83586.1 hypothetical protein [Campylobacteraceae bacterium]
MRKIFIALLLLFSALVACPPLIDRCVVYLNKPGIGLKPVPSEMIEALQRQTRADRVVIEEQDGIGRIAIVKKPRYRATSLSSSVDLLFRFKEKQCARSWESFHRCINQKRNPEDEALYQKLDREFVSRVICEEGKACVDPDFSKWRLHWETPAHLVLETDISDRGIPTVEAAKKSLHRINALLKNVVYGAHFPEAVAESSPDALFFVNEVPVQNYGFPKSVQHILKSLKETGYLEGMAWDEIRNAAALAGAGRCLYFVPEGCGKKSAWTTGSNASRIRFDDRRCPHVEILR